MKSFERSLSILSTVCMRESKSLYTISTLSSNDEGENETGLIKILGSIPLSLRDRRAHTSLT